MEKVTNNLSELIRKYDVPVPRYTSYPTVPTWDTERFSAPKWVHAVEKVFDETNVTKGISLYIHLPFCESLCTYCACNVRITKNHNVEERYLHAIIAEWELYRYIFGSVPVIRELHIGGGTPTFFSPENLRKLLTGILKNNFIHPEHEFSFEGHPNNTTREHLEVFYNAGFRRVSYGVQDLDIQVQKAINRIQPFENLERVVKISREIGFQSIGFDLIYGLPYQTEQSIMNTFQQVITLRPDRIAFYSYAHVPWVRPGQRGYEDANLPNDITKRALYNSGKKILNDSGYHDIGMDHFALKHDTLYHAAQRGKLHRNFMGYTTAQAELLIGLGASAISDAKYAYAQNARKVEDYESQVSQNKLAVFKGHLQTDEDLDIRNCILNIACGRDVNKNQLLKLDHGNLLQALETMKEENIIELSDEGLKVTESGKAFIRNICYAFDRRAALQQSDKNIFSKGI
ncbi:MAG TPA: oxygen-independent coproporphyrinogen III oxidase [Ohtaekwangia sp.]